MIKKKNVRVYTIETSANPEMLPKAALKPYRQQESKTLRHSTYPITNRAF